MTCAEVLEDLSKVDSKGALQKRAEILGKLANGCGGVTAAGGKYICRILKLGLCGGWKKGCHGLWELVR